MFIPAVSAIDVETIEKYSVSSEDSYLIAKNTFDDFVSSGALDNEIFKDSQILSNSPLLIYDVNGSILFHQYDITKDGKKLGFIRAAGSKVLGSTIIMIQETPDTINYHDIILKSEEIIKSNFKDLKHPKPQIVCYNYPKIGIMYDIINNKNERKKIIIDAAEMYIVPERYSISSGENEIWSLYDSITNEQIKTKVNEWNKEYLAIESVDNNNSQSSKSYTYKKLWGPANLVPQINGVWCAVASAKMIAYWYGTSHTMTHIADVMDAWNHSAVPPTPGGVINSKELSYYEGSPEGLQMNAERVFAAGFYWMDFKNHIKNSDVITSSIPGHVRACDGYAEYSSGSKYLHIFDPGNPASTGCTFWESLTGVTKVSYIFVT
jgi:hypothetical protein